LSRHANSKTASRHWANESWRQEKRIHRTPCHLTKMMKLHWTLSLPRLIWELISFLSLWNLDLASRVLIFTFGCKKFPELIQTEMK
jgi:hypothetical protein